MIITMNNVKMPKIHVKAQSLAASRIASPKQVKIVKVKIVMMVNVPGSKQDSLPKIGQEPLPP